jgi:hypothetical protein
LGIVVNDEHWTLRIISTQPDATAAVLAENQFNDPPAPGNQFFIATVQVTYVSGTKSEDPGFQIVSDLNTVGPSNVVYTSFGSSSRCGVIPDDIDLKGDLLPGGSLTANTVGRSRRPRPGHSSPSTISQPGPSGWRCAEISR